MTPRVGIGFDVHPFADDDKPLVLGGVVFEGRGLAGHSDGDVITHAVIDALLGAAGLGDIGEHFGDTDAEWKDADSVRMLLAVGSMLSSHGWSVVNVDCSVVLDAPKLSPHRTAMQEQLSQRVGAPVTVKGKRPEGLGAIGRGEGIAAWAVALVDHP